MNNMQTDILEHLRSPEYRPVKRAQLIRQLGLTKKKLAAFKKSLDGLIEEGQVHEGKTGRIRVKVAPGLVAGIIKRTSAGYGFLVPDGQLPELHGQDVYIASSDIGDAHTGDAVLVQLTKRRRSGGQRCGKVEQVVERARNMFVGTYFEREGKSFVAVDGKTFDSPISVGDPGAKGAQSKDKVVIEMLRFPSRFQSGEGVLTKVLGPRGAPGVDTLSVIHEFGLPDEFPDSVLEDARVQAENFDEENLDGRRDLRKETIVTIDPADARDFDDAISLTQSDDGHWHLGVHIADVAHFVPEGSPLDIEAQRRGTSVYLPRRVLPMIPEVISNGLASLQQGKMRYAKTAFIEFSPEGVPLHTELANTAIKVTKRFAYEQVMPILEAPGEYKGKVSGKVIAVLQRMHKLAMILRKRRFQRGSLQMGLPEVRIDFNKKGDITGASARHHDESHEMIEECMLAANVAVAVRLKQLALPFLRRIHREPDERKLKSFSEFVQALGFDLKKYQSRQELQALLDEVKDAPEGHAVNYGFLRSLKQAEYSPIDSGHYALAFDDYCHFTSPIRRYPDLLIHRIVNKLCRSKRRPKVMSEVDLIKMGKHCSLTERRAEKAERELTKLKLLTYMKSRVGDQIEAVITGVETFGFFCQGIEIPAEGLVHISSLADDNYQFDQASYSLSGHRAGNQFRLGDRITVEVARVDLERRSLDYKVIKSAKRAPSERRSPKRTQKVGENKRRTKKSGGKKKRRTRKRRK
jgi:ribonuclease R